MAIYWRWSVILVLLLARGLVVTSGFLIVRVKDIIAENVFDYHLFSIVFLIFFI